MSKTYTLSVLPWWQNEFIEVVMDPDAVQWVQELSCAVSSWWTPSPDTAYGTQACYRPLLLKDGTFAQMGDLSLEAMREILLELEARIEDPGPQHVYSPLQNMLIMVWGQLADAYKWRRSKFTPGTLQAFDATFPGATPLQLIAQSS